MWLVLLSNLVEYGILWPRHYHNGRRLPLTYAKGYYFFSPLQKGGGDMVTYEGLFAFCLVIIAVIQLVCQLHNKKK